MDDHNYAARKPTLFAINQIEEEHTYPSLTAHSSSLTSAYVNQLDVLTKRRYNYKLTVNFPKGTIILPDPFGGGLKYVNNPKLWPTCFEYGDLYQYLINSPGPYTQENLKAYKSLESYSYFLKGFVQAILYSAVSDDSPVCVLRGRVVHSQSVTKPPVSAWVVINKLTGSVVAAHCMCMAGLGEACSHIAAILFKLEAANRLEYTTQACTEKACTWNRDFFKGAELEPCTIQDLHFVKPRYDRCGQIRSVKSNVDVTSKATLESLDLSTLRQINPDACIFSLLPKEDEEETDTASENENNVKIRWEPKLPKPFCDLNINEIPEHQSITSEQAHLIASCTTGQRESNLWPLYRFGRVTASVLGLVVKVMDGSSKRDVSSLCAKMLGKNSFCPTKAMKWGIDHESVALDALKKHLEFEGHQDVQMRSVGLYIDPDSPFIGASPDALVSCACCGLQSVEVKCPNNKANANNLDPNTFLGAKAVDCLKVLGNETQHQVHLKERHDYFFQVVCQIGVLHTLMNVSSGLFVVWTLRGLFVQKIDHNEDLWKQVKDYCKKFFTQYLQPAIVREIHKPEL
ncbi:uncharacterized protein [Asterias amurensis]|uniref:uncharacterized protein n=1 Tax=Asterias amurensis TaxID=7602 RepID=UPI003AB49EBE